MEKWIRRPGAVAKLSPAHKEFLEAPVTVGEVRGAITKLKADSATTDVTVRILSEAMEEDAPHEPSADAEPASGGGVADRISDLAGEHGLVAPTGAAGSAVFFHCALLHASPGNISPWSRNIVYLTANVVSNAIRKPTRPAYIAARDFTTVKPLADDCLLGDLTKENN